MKKTFLSVLLVAITVSVRAQPQDAAGLKKIDTLPVFSITAAPDSTPFNHTQLQKGKPLVLIFFNPDCDHCQNETKELLANKDVLKEIHIVMVSALPFHLIKAFYTAYQLASMPNIIMGQDVNFTLGSLYHPHRYPAIFIYGSSGTLSKVFAGGAGVPAILEAVK